MLSALLSIQRSAHGDQCCWEASGAAARRQQKCSGVAVAGRDAMDFCIPVSLGSQVVRALPDTRRCLAILVSIGPARARISLETQWNKPLLKTCCWFLFFKLETCRQSILNNDFTNSMVEWLPKNSFCGTSEGPSTLLRQGHLHKSFRISLSYYTWMPPIQA